MSDWHYLYLEGLHAVSLYANPSSLRAEASLQWVLPGFEQLFTATWKASPMKGVWNKEKSVSDTYRPSLDALSAVDPSLLSRAIHAAVSDGGAFMVACTRDYGAICLTMMQGNDRAKVYCANAAELAEALTDLVASLSSQGSSEAPAKAKR